MNTLAFYSALTGIIFLFVTIIYAKKITEYWVRYLILFSGFIFSASTIIAIPALLGNSEIVQETIIYTALFLAFGLTTKLFFFSNRT